MEKRRLRSGQPLRLYRRASQVVYLVPTTILGSAALQYFCTADEGISGTCGSAVPFPHACPAEENAWKI